MTDSQIYYTCPHHKIEVKGEKRDTFQKEYYDALMVVDMMTSMKLYKYVNVACHCTSNYELFDKIIKYATSLVDPTVPQEPFAESIANEDTKDPELTTN
jgi:hypothetical protein